MLVGILREVNSIPSLQLNFDITRVDPDPISQSFVHAVREIIVSSRVWTDEVEASYMLLVKLILHTVQKLAATGALLPTGGGGSPGASNTETETDEDGGDDDPEDDLDGDDDAGAGNASPVSRRAASGSGEER